LVADGPICAKALIKMAFVCRAHQCCEGLIEQILAVEAARSSFSSEGVKASENIDCRV